MSTGFRGPLIYTRVGHPFDGLPLEIMSAALSHTRKGVAAGNGIPYIGPAAHATAPSNNTVSDRGAGIRLTSTSTSTTGGTADNNNAGQLVLTSGTTDEDSSGLQWLSCPFRYVSTKDLWCFARLAVSVANVSDLIFGLFGSDTTLIAASAIAVDDGIGFFKAATATDLTSHVRKNTTSTTATMGLTIADAAFFVCGLTVINGAIRFYAAADTGDRVLTKEDLFGAGTAAVATNAPDDIDVVLTLGVGQEGGTTARTATVDWMFAVGDV